MKRPWCVLATSLAASCAGSASQSGSAPSIVPSDPRAYHGELLVQYRPVGIGQHADGHLWVAGNSGQVISADSVHGDWRVAVPGAFSLLQGSAESGELSIVYGMLAERDTAFVIVSRDGGRHWTKAPIGRGRHYVGAAHVDHVHGTWLAGYSQSGSSGRTDVLLFSRDARTWSERTAPQARAPFASIALSGDSLGILVSMNNDAFVTHDGGATWQRIASPHDQGRYDRRGNPDWIRFHDAYAGAGTLLVNQEGRWFSSRADSIAWRHLPQLDNAPLFRDASGNGFCSIDSTRRLLQLDARANVVRRQQRTLITPSVALSCRDGRIAAVDMESRVYSEQNGELTYGWPVSSTVPLDTVARWYRHNGTTWGTTGRYLYAKDNAERWYRTRFDASGIAGFLTRSTDEIFVWDGRGNQSMHNRRTGRTQRITSLDGFDVKGVQVAGDRWFAWGGRHHESAGRIEVARTFYGGEFFGTRNHGFVVSSRDSGSTWKLVDSWPEGGVHAMHVSPDAERIVLLSYLGSVRELRWNGNAYVGRTLIVANTGNSEVVPYFEYPFVLYFANDSAGIARGGFHHSPARSFRTRDGGRTWERVGERDVPYDGGMPHGSRYLAWNGTGFYLLSGMRVDTVVRLDSLVNANSVMNGVVRRAADVIEFMLHERPFNAPGKRYWIDTRSWRVTSVVP